MVISDAHKGLAKATIGDSFIGCSWQRYIVHMMRNELAHVPGHEKERFAAKLKQIWLQHDFESALAYAEHFMDTAEKQYPFKCWKKAWRTLCNSATLKRWTTEKFLQLNLLERLNREIHPSGQKQRGRTSSGEGDFKRVLGFLEGSRVVKYTLIQSLAGFYSVRLICKVCFEST